MRKLKIRNGKSLFKSQQNTPWGKCSHLLTVVPKNPIKMKLVGAQHLTISTRYNLRYVDA